MKDGATVYYELTISSLKDRQKHRIGYLILIHDISGLKRTEKEMEKLSWGDDLTGLYNRRGFKILANQTINMARRMKLNATLVFMDLDELKWINDLLGHAAGDQALIDTAQILKNVFRSSDIIARVGGDEFVALAIDSAENPGENMLKRLQEQLDIHNTWFDQDYAHPSALDRRITNGIIRVRWNCCWKRPTKKCMQTNGKRTTCGLPLRTLHLPWLHLIPAHLIVESGIAKSITKFPTKLRG